MPPPHKRGRHDRIRRNSIAIRRVSTAYFIDRRAATLVPSAGPALPKNIRDEIVKSRIRANVHRHLIVIARRFSIRGCPVVTGSVIPDELVAENRHQIMCAMEIIGIKLGRNVSFVQQHVVFADDGASRPS